MSDLRDKITELDVEQLHSLLGFVEEKIAAKSQETKRTVWRVVNRGMCYGNFREEQYVQAAEFLLKMAIKTDSDDSSDRLDRHLELISKRVPLSEYEDWFK